MFHRMPLISATAVFTTAFIFLLTVLFASSLSSLGTAQAEDSRAPVFSQNALERNLKVGSPVSATDPEIDYGFSATNHDMPEVSIYAVMPEVAEEGRSITVTLKLSRPLRDDEKYCFRERADQEKDGTVCVEGGIIVWDTYNDHLYDADGPLYDNGHIPSEELVKFVFRGNEVEKRLNVSIKDDECITPGRTIQIMINQAFRSDTYGYTSEDTVSTVPVDGNDDSDGNGQYIDPSDHSKGECAPVDPGDTEEFIGNHAPLFTGVENTRTVAENTATGQNIGDPVTATDPEDGDILTYLLGGIDGSSFNIDTSTGQLKTKDALNYENKSSYTVTVQVRDSLDIHGVPDMTYDDSIDITISVTNVNERPEFVSTAPTTLNVAENTGPGIDIGDPVTATDPESDTLTYSLGTGDGASFGINSATGQIKTNSGLNYEIDSSYTVTVSVTDSKDDAGSTDTTADDTHQVTITVTNVVEPPTFDEEPAPGENSITRTVPENTPAGQPIGAPVAATDEEGYTLTYSLDVQDGTLFDIDSNGQIKTKDPLDYETTQAYYLTVSVTDSKDANGDNESPGIEDDSIAVTINVTDVNEPPQFADDAPATLSVAENTAAETNIGGPFTATDPDANETLTYSLDDRDGGSFDIDTTNGQIKTKDALDHEAKASYAVTVSVTDSRDESGNTEQTPSPDDTHTVTITVTDEDDLGAITFSPEQPIAGTTLTATLTDQDGVQSEDTWQWEISDDQSSWTEITDATTNSFVPGSGDIDKYLRVTVTYTQTDSSTKTVEDETGAILTAQPTNQQPSFDDTTATRSVAENTAAGQDIGDPITAIHPDSVGTLVYSLDTTGATSFDIDSATGQLKTKVDLDHETMASYTVTASVSDGMDDYSNADTKMDDTIEVTITVTNMDIPAAPEQPTVNPTPGAAAGLSVTWTAITATDEAPVDGYDVQYRVKDADPPADWLTANVAVSGTSATITGLDYNNTYEVQVRSKNGEGESAWSDTGEGSIPSRLSVSFSPASQRVTEGNSATFTVTVSPDADRELPIPISVTRGSAESGDYTVSGLTNGNLTFADTENSKTFTISTTNDSDRDNETVSLGFGQLPAAVGPGTQSTAQLTIDDTTPAPSNNGGNNPSPLSVSFQQASYTVTEGSSRTITVNVSPAADRALSIRISASSSNAESGDYSVRGTPLVFASGDSSKTFTISTTDDSDRNDETVTLGFTQLPIAVSTATPSTATLTINDTTPAPKTTNNGGGGGGNRGRSSSGGGGVYYAPPSNSAPNFIEGASTQRSVAENTASPIPIGSPVSATDTDNDKLTYYLGGLDAWSFSINPNSGHLLTSAELDFETKASYSVYVLVSDGEGGSDRIEVSISVIDIAETPVPVPVAQEAAPTPEPEPVPPPTEVPTPEPTATPVPTPTLAPTPTPTLAPTPTAQPTPTLAPTPTAVPTPTLAPTPTAVPTPTLAPTPTAVPTPTPAPTPTAQPTPTAAPELVPELEEDSYEPRLAPPLITDLGNASQLGGPQAAVSEIPEEIRKLRMWPIILLALGTVMELIAVGLFMREKELDKRRW